MISKELDKNSTIEWPSLVFEQKFLDSVDKLTARRFGEGGLAEEASTFVIDYLSAEDWQRCNSFQGKASPRTFLVSMASNAIEEFSRKRFGRPRPPSWLQELGESWIKLWRSLCLERQPLPAIIDRFCEGGFRVADEVAKAARLIKARIPSCGLGARDSLDVEDIDALSDAVQSETSDQCGSETPEFDNPFHAELMMMMRLIIEDEPKNEVFQPAATAGFDDLASQHGEKLEQLRSALALSDQEKIMLRMIHVDGLSKSATSKALGLPAHSAGRIVNEAMSRIHTALQQCGLDLDALLESA